MAHQGASPGQVNSLFCSIRLPVFQERESSGRDLNPGPLPYQGSALPLSYQSNRTGSSSPVVLFRIPAQ